MFPWIVADIGGTNARFSLVTDRNPETGEYALSQQREFSTADFDTFAACFDAYLSSMGGPLPQYACIAVAGPVSSDQVQLTNVDWVFSIAETCERFALKRLEVINDFAALACSVTHLGPDDCLQIYAGEPGTLATKAIVGPGTGLGVAALVHNGGNWSPLPSEGGHRAYSPQTDREINVYKELQKKFGYVSAENLLSGAGMVNIYRALATLEQRQCDDIQPSQITEAALNDRGDLADVDLARETLDIFCGVLGSVCGDVALTYGAKGGVYLGGGILPRMKEYLLNSDFVARFKAKGVISSYLEDISVVLIVHKNPALIGAAAWLENCGVSIE